MAFELFSKKSKVFCIGRNKTGTTSIHQVLQDFGYKLGRQADAELLMGDWAKRDFRRIVQYCRTADAFQDVPFSLDYTYQILDHVFSGSKFILTVRNNADEWYESLLRFHGKLMKVDGVPTMEDVKNCSYRSKGWLWKQQQYVYGIDESTLYDEKIYKAHYNDHNNRVLHYFKRRENDLLVLNLSQPDVMKSLCTFLGVEYVGQVMPHLNRTRD